MEGQAGQLLEEGKKGKIVATGGECRRNQMCKEES